MHKDLYVHVGVRPTIPGHYHLSAAARPIQASAIWMAWHAWRPSSLPAAGGSSTPPIAREKCHSHPSRARPRPGPSLTLPATQSTRYKLTEGPRGTEGGRVGGRSRSRARSSGAGVAETPKSHAAPPPPPPPPRRVGARFIYLSAFLTVPLLSPSPPIARPGLSRLD